MRKTTFFSLALTVLVSVFMASCTTYTYTSRSVNIKKHNINDSPIAAQIRVDYKKQVSGQSAKQKVKAEAIREAEYNCLMESGVDVIVDPIIKVEYTMFSGYKAEIQGFAGYYKETKQGIEKFVEDGYKKEDIEKYLILTDPDFRELYYQPKQLQGNGEVVNYYVKSATVSNSNKKSVSQNQEVTTLQQTKVVKKEKKQKKQKKGNFFTRMFNPDLED